MVKLEIKGKENSLYVLENNNHQNYNMLLKFWDIEESPNVGDIIYINELLLDTNYEGYSNFYTFGGLHNQYGKKDISLDDEDVIMLIMEKKKIYLKRLYG